MVIGKSLLGAGARIPCIRTRLQVKIWGEGLSLSLALAEPRKTLYSPEHWEGNAESCFTASVTSLSELHGT